jgi:hypothetical protein
VELPFAGRTIEARFGPGEVKTFLVSDHLEDAVREISLLEWPPSASLKPPRSGAQMATQRGCPPSDGSSHFIVP